MPFLGSVKDGISTSEATSCGIWTSPCHSKPAGIAIFASCWILWPSKPLEGVGSLIVSLMLCNSRRDYMSDVALSNCELDVLMFFCFGDDVYWQANRQNAWRPTFVQWADHNCPVFDWPPITDVPFAQIHKLNWDRLQASWDPEQVLRKTIGWLRGVSLIWELQQRQSAFHELLLTGISLYFFFWLFRIGFKRTTVRVVGRKAKHAFMDLFPKG